MKNVYFIGIGGIGMSNLARYFKHEGYQVAGYDRTRTPLCAQLENEGIAIHYEDNVALIPEDFRQKEETLVVRTPAVPLTHSELQYFEQAGFNMMKRAAVLGEISKDKRALCVAGTHGKTTTSTLLAHLLRQSPIDCNAFLGGISKNYQNNLLLSAKSDFAVIEADEYDRSFHHLRPYMAIITSVDPDHLDIYGTHEAYLESFAHFTSLIQEGGALVKKVGLPLKERCQASVKVYQYAGPNASQAEKSQADFYADKPTFVKGRLYFDFHYPQGCIEQMELGLPMMIHVENAVAAMAIAHLNGVSDEDLRAALACFQGNQRRFDYQIRRDDFVYIDDYAHHPDELRASIASLKALYADKKITGIFQPHLYSRTRDFAPEFAQVLSLLDEVILLDIYPAREEPIPGVSSEMIFKDITCPHKERASLQTLCDLLKDKELEVLVTLGAGDIDKLVPQIKSMFEQ